MMIFEALIKRRVGIYFEEAVVEAESRSDSSRHNNASRLQ